jgi:hypothetical protein
MEPVFAVHNTHRDGLETFVRVDPQLRALAQQPLVHEPRLLTELPRHRSGVYTLGGARQIGKTTLLKQWMVRLLREGVPAESIAFLTGELIDDHHQLVVLLQAELVQMPPQGPLFLIVDEVTYIRGWERAVKYCADAGLLDRVVLMVTGSDLTIVREARAMLPGRRGDAERVDYHLYPVDFATSAALTGSISQEEISALTEGRVTSLERLSHEAWDRIERAVELYLVHGGFLTAMNDLAANEGVRPATLTTYSDWIRGDMLKRGKSEPYLKEILRAINRRTGSQVTWNALARELSIDHPATVADYVHLLADMDAVFIQPALNEGLLTAAPKKARKVFPTDPFIGHAIRGWLQPVPDPFTEQILPACRSSEASSMLVEAVLVTHARRWFPTYYIKSEGEVDLAVVDEGTFWPIEIKWRTQSRPKSLKQIRKYPNGIVAARCRRPHRLEDTPVYPLPVVLCQLSAGRRPGIS